MTTYLLDANIFTQAKNLHYGFDFCPAFWEWIDEAHAAGVVYSVDGVRAELVSGNDDLATWARRRPNGFFIMPSAATVPSLQATSIWANGAGYGPAAVTTFLQVADYYLTAQAHEQQYTVVTHGIVSPSTKRIEIPNACLGLNVRCVTPFAMLRAEQAPLRRRRGLAGLTMRAGGAGRILGRDQSPTRSEQWTADSIT